MSEDLYEVLGVDKEADEAAIKRAYRKRSMATHPDRGGDEEEFKRLNLAYEVLSDPKKRQRYDKSGDSGERPADPALAILGSHISGVTAWLVSSGKDPKFTDILDLVRKKLAEDSRKLLEAQKENSRRIDKLREIAARIGVKKTKARKGKKATKAPPEAPENLLAQIVLQPVKIIQEEIRHQEVQIEQMKLALELLDDYEYQLDKNPGAGFGGGWATLQIGVPPKSFNLDSWIVDAIEPEGDTRGSEKKP